MDSKDRMNGRLIFEGCAGRAAERVLAGDEAALVAEDEALRTGVAAPSVAAVLAVGSWDAVALADRHADLATGYIRVKIRVKVRV